MKPALLILGGVVVIIFATSPAWSTDDLPQGIAAFHEHRSAEAMALFIQVLQKDPRNSDAHTYLHLLAQDLEAAHQTRVQQDRLDVLAKASKVLDEQRRDPYLIDNAILDTTEADARMRDSRQTLGCEQADVEERLGHLLVANDLIFKVLNENASSSCGQRLLSVLQSRLRDALDKGTFQSSIERYALEGFYAYGQADYSQASTAWTKAQSIFQQSPRENQPSMTLDSLRFLPYQKIAAAHVEEAQKANELRQWFVSGITFFDQGAYGKALALFRRIAIANPEYPHLSAYLAQAESRAELEREKQLSEENRVRVAALLDQGVLAIQQSQYTQAQKLFQDLLALDPSHPQARSYAALVAAELARQLDPVAAQHHYEAGIIAYASGKLDDAKREWHITMRMDPKHEKAWIALSKVEKELAYYREVP